jgi:CBS domain-containing protein
MSTEIITIEPQRSRPTLLVEDVMQYQVVTVPPQMTVRELVQTLIDESISGAPVLDGSGRILGVVSATDVLRLAAQEAEIPFGQVSWDAEALPEEQDDELPAYYRMPDASLLFTAPSSDALAESSFDQLTVREIMTPIAFTVAPGDSVLDLVRMLVRGRIHRALVVQNGALLGIVTPFDVLRHSYDV